MDKSRDCVYFSMLESYIDLNGWKLLLIVGLLLCVFQSYCLLLLQFPHRDMNTIQFYSIVPATKIWYYYLQKQPIDIFFTFLSMDYCSIFKWMSSHLHFYLASRCTSK